MSRFAIMLQGKTKPGIMNKLEASYAAELELRKTGGEVLWYRYEGFKLRLAKDTFYTPDFAVMVATGALECHEVKSYWDDKARVKIKLAADQYPFQFFAIKAIPKKAGGGWEVESF